MAPQNSQNCGRHLRKRKQSDAEFAGNDLLRIVIIDIVMNTLLDRVTRHPAGMHCPSWDDAFVSSTGYGFSVRMFVNLSVGPSSANIVSISGTTSPFEPKCY